MSTVVSLPGNCLIHEVIIMQLVQQQ